MVLNLFLLKKINLPFQEHEEDLWVCGDVFHCGCTGANLTSHNITEQMNHILLPLLKNRIPLMNDW